MLMFASSINTLLDIRLDEFNEIIRYRIKPHFFESKAYPYFRNNSEWCTHYWQFVAFLERIREKQNHRHQVAKEIKESIHLFKNVRSNKVALQHFDQVLNQMIPEIESLCKKIMELSEKLHNEFRESN